MATIKVSSDFDLALGAATPRELLAIMEGLRKHMCEDLDGRPFGNTVLWASEVTADLDAFIQSTNKSIFVSEHEKRWPGIGNLYCWCFARAADRLVQHLLSLSERLKRRDSEWVASGPDRRVERAYAGAQFEGARLAEARPLPGPRSDAGACVI